MNKKVYFDDLQKNDSTGKYTSGSMRYQEEDDNGVVIDESKTQSRTLYSGEIASLNDGSKTLDDVANAYADSITNPPIVDVTVDPVDVG